LAYEIVVPEAQASKMASGESPVPPKPEAAALALDLRPWTFCSAYSTERLRMNMEKETAPNETLLNY
jgi:hypothetical protein